MHNIRDMRLMNSIRHIAPNDNGLCSLSLMSHLAFPISNECGELQIYDAENMQVRLKIRAHESPLSAFNFSPNGALLATASEKGETKNEEQIQIALLVELNRIDCILFQVR